MKTLFTLVLSLTFALVLVRLSATGQAVKVAVPNQAASSPPQTQSKNKAKDDAGPVAHVEADFRELLQLPDTVGDTDELPDNDEPRSTPRRHPLRQPGGPSHGGTGDNDDHRPTGTPAAVLPTATIFSDKIKVKNDPMVAVGDHFVGVTDAQSIYFFDKKTGNPIKLPQPNLDVSASSCQDTAAAGGMCMEQFFAKFLAPFLSDSAGNPDRHRPNPDDVNRHLPKPDLGIMGGDCFLPLVCDPDNPIAAGCVNDAYDTRILYDKANKRFWVECNLRNPIYGSGDPSAHHFVVPDSTHLHQRFTAIAVSKTEDPRNGFHEFRLSSRPGDWPTIAVHDPFLVIGSFSKKKYHLFDAKKLRDGDNSGIIHLGSYTDSDFDCDGVWPVIQHDLRNGVPFVPTFPVTNSGSTTVPTFLVGTGGGDKVIIYAFDAPKTLIDQPSIEFFRPSLMSVTLNIHHDLSSVIAIPVYRNGFIYLTWEECADGGGHWADICNRRVRVVKIPVFRITGLGNQIGASTKRSLGFEDYVFGGDAPSAMNLTSYDIPALDVTKDDDVVIVYGRAAPLPVPGRPGAFYAVSYHDNRGLVLDGILHEANCTDPDQLDCIHMGQGDTHLDLSCVAIDPTDDRTAWMAHEFVDGAIGDFRMAVGHAKP